MNCSRFKLKIFFFSIFFISAFTVFGYGNDDHKNDSWFTTKEVDDHVWQISDHGNDNMYLVEGEEKALLIDAGTGVADLASYVQTLTSRPIVVVNTHGHPDHSGNDFQFDGVFANPADFNMILKFNTKENQKAAVKQMVDVSPSLSDILLKDIEDFKTPKLIPVEEGFVFDLGGRKLEVIETPGHTKGSICLIDKENGLLFSGDNDNSLVWLFLEECFPLDQYLNSLQKLLDRSDEFSTILPGHGEPLDKEFVAEQINCVKNILSGVCKGEHYNTFVDYAKVCYFKRAGVAFNPNNLFSK
jgi:hydroxyacylglutathione hydrolase